MLEKKSYMIICMHNT